MGSGGGAVMSRGGRKQMTARERLSLSTWEKWRRFGRVPWKFILNLFLVACCSAQVVLYQMDVIPYIRGSIETWQLLLAPPGAALSSVQPFGYANRFYVYRMSTLVDSMQNTRDTYYGVRNTTVDSFQYVMEDDPRGGGAGAGQVPSPVRLALSNYAEGVDVFRLDDSFSDEVETRYFNLYEDSGLGPFDRARANGTLAELVHTMSGAELGFRLQNYKFAGRRTCYEWDVRVNYDFSVRGRIAMTIDATPDFCPEERAVPWYHRGSAGFIVLFSLIGTFSFVLLLLHLRAVWRSVTIYQSVKMRMAVRRGEAPTQMFNQLSCRDRMRFFNLWFIYALVGNVSNMAGSIMALQSLVTVSSPSVSYIYFMGLGALFTWVCILQFFETTTSYYVLITTLAKGTPRVARFLVGVLPVFLGYAMFGVAFFGTETVRFSTVDQACVTLFALLNGDVIHDVFDEIHPAHPYISRIYLYTFISLFIYAVLNIFVAIIEDAFFASKAFQLQQQKESKNLDLEKVEPLELVDRLWAPAEDGNDGAGGGSGSPSSRSRSNVGGGARAAAYDYRTGGGLSGASSPLVVGGGPSSPGPSSRTAAPAWQRVTSQPLTQPLLSAASSPLMTRGSSAPAAVAPSTPVLQRQGSAVSVAAASEMDPSVREVIESLAGISSSFSGELSRYLADLLSGSGGPDGGPAPRAYEVRPPHDLSFFPCGFDDCLYCAVRAVYAEVLEGAREDLHQAVASCLERRPGGVAGGDDHAGDDGDARRASEHDALLDFGRGVGADDELA